MPPPSFLFFLLIYTIASFHYLTPCSGSDSEICPETELLSFKLSMNDIGGLMSSWKPQVDCCMWEHIVCSNSTGHVLELHLRGPGLAAPGLIGTLNDSLINLTHLRYLDLSQNYFGGSAISAFIGSFSNLEYLDLSDVGFRGALDDSLLNLTHLRFLDMSVNSFGGAIPTFIKSFSKLEHLDLRDAGFNGMLDDSLLNMTHLRYRDLSANLISGAIPALIGSLPNLEYLGLSGAGTIPHTIGNLSSLRWLSLYGPYYMDKLEADSLEWMFGLSHLEHLEFVELIVRFLA